IYINGQLIQSETTAIGSLANDFPFQMGDVGGFNLFEGQIDEVSVWSKALSELEVQALVANSLAGDEANLEAYYKFDQTDAAITTLPDRSVNQNDGVLENFGGAASWPPSGALFTFAPSKLIATMV